ncbi:MAG TPA: V-type ATPase subunit [Bryobacteraceae bacterium]|nr:V-type ATPase subunit [Bryobacteraceae bacterium]
MKCFTYAASQGFIRARLSRLLDQDTWMRLLNCRSTGDLAQALRQTQVGTAVSREGEVRLQMLRGGVAAAAQALTRYLPRGARTLVHWYNLRFEVENLKTVLRSVHYGLNPRRAAHSLVPLATGTIRTQWEKLLEAGSIPAVMEQLRGSPFAVPLEQASERYRQEQRLFYIEVGLDLFYFRRLVQLIETLKGSDAAQATVFLGRWIAVQNLLWAYRYRIYGRMSPEEILNYTLHRACGAGLDTLRRVALGAPLDGEARRLGFSLPSGLSEAEALSQLELQVERERHRRAAAAIRQPLFHLGGALAFLVVLDAEVRDLAVIVEGNSIGLTGAEMAPHLLRSI